MSIYESLIGFCFFAYCNLCSRNEHIPNLGCDLGLGKGLRFERPDDGRSRSDKDPVVFGTFGTARPDTRALRMKSGSHANISTRNASDVTRIGDCRACANLLPIWEESARVGSVGGRIEVGRI